MKSDQSGFLNFRSALGIVIVVIGLLALLASLGLDIDFRIWDFWPVILILLGLSILSRPHDRGSLYPGWLFLLFGVLFLLDNLDIIHFGYRVFWPLVIIFIGLAILRHGFGFSAGESSESDQINVTAVLGGGDYNYSSKSLKGGRVFAFMGGAKINLREADISEESATVDVFTIMGGVEIGVPASWQVTVHGVPVLGGIDNKTVSQSAAESRTKRLIVKGTAIMGGIEVKN